MFFHQFYLGCLSHASYLIGDEKTGTAIVVDPQRDTEQYVTMAAKQGLRIEHVFLTHFHADFLAGHLELRDKFGAQLYVGHRGNTEYEVTPLRQGDRFEWGDIAIEVRETPGHTPESVCLLVFDDVTPGADPYGVLTGDTLFIGDVGRPDLFGSVGTTANELAALLYESLHTQLMPLPDETRVYPAHGAGSMCGKNLSTETSSTIGAQRHTNVALKAGSVEEFVALVTADQPEAPAYFSIDAMLNQKERPTLEGQIERALHGYPIDDFLKRAEGGQILDVRDDETFAAAHLPGSINIGLDGRFATWCGSVLDPEKPIWGIAPTGREREAILRLGRIGFDHAAGYLENAEAVLATAETRSFDRFSPESLAGESVMRVDVRQPGEFAAGHLEQSTSMPLAQVLRRIDELPRETPIAFICKTGYRSATAISLLEREGFTNLIDLHGGVDRWLAEGRGLTAGATP